MKNQSITLVGMSNVGKSYWRRELEKAGFRPFCCDDKIEEGLGPFLKQGGYQGIEDVAHWMGQPYEPRSSQNQARYLDWERSVMNEAVELLRSFPDQHRIIDTTGSVIYTGVHVLIGLRKHTTVVFLDAPESLHQEMYRRYLANPKPVIWGDQFQPLPDEDPLVALARCYPRLLESRNRRYRQMAHIIIDYDEHRAPAFTATKFLERVAAC